MVKIAINGFGRIGRCAARIILERNFAGEEVELVAINDTATRDMTRYLLKYDSVHGEFKPGVRVIDDENIEVANGENIKNIRVFSTRDLNELNYADYGADVVLECTGKFLTTEKYEPYLCMRY